MPRILIGGFVKIFQHITVLEYRSKEATEAWMKKIMVNECLMFLRKRRAFAFSYLPEEVENCTEYTTIPVDDLEVEEILCVDLKIMKNHPAINIHIIGHTDSLGRKEYNKNLSFLRAREVAQYLQQNGIAAHRITYERAGEENPVSNNDTEKGRSMNRRVEYKFSR
jgi:hypothetical protein